MKKYWLPFLLACVFFASEVLTLSDYGINWDQPYRFLRGQALAQFLLTGQKKLENTNLISPILIKPGENATRYDFSSSEDIVDRVKLPDRPRLRHDFEEYQKKIGKRLTFYQNEAWDAEYFISKEAPGHPPFSEILAAFSNRLFHQALGMVGDIESYQLVNIFISAIGIFVVAAFAFDITRSRFAALVAGLSLGLFPFFFAESHFNMKDPLEASFFAGSIWAFWHWVRGDKFGRLGVLGWFGLFVLFVGLALSVKWNIMFLPFIILPWLILIRKTEQFKKWFRLGRLGLLGGLGLLGAILFLILVSPVSWGNPINWVWNIALFYWNIGTDTNNVQPPGFILPGGFNIYPVSLLLAQTPEVILALGVLGVIWAVRGRDSFKSGYLLFFWFLVPVVRYSLPGIHTYSGYRQILEVLPAMAVLAGVGAGYLAERLKAGIIVITFIIVISVILVFPIIRFHPNENVYFNSLAGGLKGAEKKNLVDFLITNGNVYKQGVDWLNQHAEKDANLALLDGRMFAISPLWLRDDISFSPYHFSGLDQKGEYIMMNVTKLDKTVFAYRYPIRFLNPVYIIAADGIPILTIFKNDPKYLKKGFAKEQTTSNFQVKINPQSTQGFLEINLKKKVRVTRIVVVNAPKSCLSTNYYSFTDELITFSSYKDVYAINERNNLGPSKIEFSFPAEVSNVIKIFPKSNFSCFINGRISSVSYLPL